MRSRAVALVVVTTAICFLATTANAAAGQGETLCTWGGTPAAPTGFITLSPGVTNTPSTGPIQGFHERRGVIDAGSLEPGDTCAASTPFHAKAIGLPPVVRAEAQPGLAGTAPVLLYDADGNVVGSEQAQFLTTLGNESDPAYLNCGTPQGLTEAFWSDTLELFASNKG